jgi:putative serine protease PepD
MTDSTPRPGEGTPAGDGGHLGDDAVTTPSAHEAAPVHGEATPWEQTERSDAEEGAAFRRKQRRGIILPVAAVAVVAALIGGGIGAGIAIAVNPRSTVAASSGAQGITINNPSTATAVSAVAAKASPSVVTISVSATNESGTGSGIIMSADGYVLTNNHVVTLDGDSANGTISVTTTDGHIYPAKVVGTDPLNDLAVIKLTGASGLTPATFANSSDLNVGDSVVAIGAPLDLPNTVTTGIVSALGRSIAVASSAVPKGSSGSDGSGGSGGDSGGSGGSPFNFWDFGDGSGGSGSGSQSQAQTQNIYLSVLQTDAAINPGNSGGALLDAQGEVIGVNVAIAGTDSSSSSGAQSGSIGVGFAIPSTVAKRIADDIIAGKKPSHGQLGVTSVANETATTGTVAGVKVSAATSGSPAADAGIRSGDIITAVGKVAVTSYTDLAGQVRSYPAGTKVPVTFSRGGDSRTVTVTLGSAPTS